MKIAIVSSLAQPHELVGYHAYIGCDYGAFICAQANIIMTLAVGDFDSVTHDQFELIKQYAHDIHELNNDKDISDTEYALSLTQKTDDVTIIGGLGGRLDHEFANMLCLLKYPHAKLVNDTNEIFVVSQKTHIPYQKGYLSLFPLQETIVSIQGVKFPLNQTTLSAFDTLCLSNEIEDQEAIIEVNHPCLVMLSQ
ncbi:MAG: thiamine diphosphokinase [Erysipelothrix sp.]|jgi:thiamine pyrophosphokinase|nr:thiamine diphosphokinase [Erysipelothrix sp.]